MLTFAKAVKTVHLAHISEMKGPFFFFSRCGQIAHITFDMEWPV